MNKKKKIINLPALPSSWNELTTEQLEGIVRIRTRLATLMTNDEKRGDVEYRLQVFLLLGGFKVTHKTVKNDDGTFTYLLQRRGIKPRLLMERLPFQSWEIAYWIDQYLKFLDEPMERTLPPYTFIRRYGRRFKCPEALMTDVTYQQHSAAQAYLINYWDNVKLLEAQLENGGSKRSVKEIRRNIREARANFLATLFTSPSLQVQVGSEGDVRRVHRKTWTYDAVTAEQNVRYFRHGSHVLFAVMSQFFQSVQAYFKQSFPDLFTSHGNGTEKDPLIMETEMLNAIMKYAGFKDYQSIYDSNSVFIFGVMNNMSKEAKAIEDMNAKMKRRR